MMKKVKKSERGSVILIAVLVMAVLVVISLSLSGLVVAEIVVQRDETERLKAFYAAESGIERGLLDIYEHNLPGFTRPENVAVDILEAGKNIKSASYFTPLIAMKNLFVADAAGYRYQVVGQDAEVPCSYDNEVNNQYLTLSPNQSVTLPLHKFVSVAPESKREIVGFLVEYYVTGSGLDQGVIANEVLTGVDVLRWKIFGLNTAINQIARRLQTGEHTDAISDYLPLNSLTNTAENPSQFATALNLITQAGAIFGYKDKPIWIQGGYYRRENLTAENTDLYRQQRFDIKRFLNPNEKTDLHEYNYLMLTNVLGENVKLERGVFQTDTSNTIYERLLGTQKLHYRLRADDTKNSKETLACEGFLVRADGFFRGAKQSLDMKIALDTFLPVFDFALYERDL